LSIVSIETTGDIAFVVIDNPPVNALSLDVRSALFDAISHVENSNIRAGALLCGGKTFSVGADIKEFDKLRESPTLPEIILALERSKKIWCAALFGTAFGGGLELGLGCDYRIAHKDTQFSFPEVLIGTIPGAGGTQRTPRLTGIAAALDLAASGKRISAQEALALKLIDEITSGGLRAGTFDFLSRQREERKLSTAPVNNYNKAEIEKMRAVIIKRARGQMAPVEAANAVMLAAKLPLIEGLREERAIFERLSAGVQSKALRYQFFAEREVMKIPEFENAVSLPLRKIGIVGGGTMGCGIAAACVLAEFETILVEKNPEALDKADARLDDIFAEAQKRGHKVQKKKLSFSGDIRNASTCDLVIEAVFEDINVKKSVLAQTGDVLKPGGIIATNTSYLDINELAQASGRPEHFLGLHFFAPAHVMKLVEIVRGDKTSNEVLAMGFAFAKTLKKIGVLVGASEGFIGNRIWQHYRREIEIMVEEGASPYEIDQSMEEYGFVLGPFKVADLSGLDVAWAQRKRHAASRSKTERYVEIPDLICEAGRFGRKTGVGWYDYENDKAQPASAVESIIAQERKRKNIVPRTFSSEEIRTRVLNVIAKEGEKMLEEGVALRASDIDVVMVNGYGYPRWRGGPMFEAENKI
jgi:3-hydroxyacyl-CoA dehydrogenase